MTETPRHLTQNPNPAETRRTDILESDPAGPEPAPPPFEVVSQVLDLVRLSGALFLRADFTAPWAYTSPPGPDLAAALLPGSDNVVLFHIIGEGRCWITLEDGSRKDLEQGDVVVLPYGDWHQVGFPDDVEPVNISDLFPPPPWDEVSRINHGGGGEPTLLVCGYLKGDDLLFDPVLRALPPLFVVHPPAGPAATWVSASIEYARAASQDPGRATGSRQRLPELLFTEVLRLYLESGEAQLTGWLAALRDPVVGQAISLLHANPAHGWTVAELATAVAASKTVLVDRFDQLLGRPPIRYLTEWRLNLAAGLLRTTHLTVAEVAAKVGYNSEEAFSRAFKRELGKAPGHWRTSASR